MDHMYCSKKKIDLYLTLAEPYGLVRQSLIKTNRALTDLQPNLKGFQFLNINI